MDSMNITNAHYYKYINSDENVAINCTIDGKKVTVPLDPNNRHYAEILKQVEAGTLIIQDAE